MEHTESTLFAGDIGQVKYTFNVPGLSFADYRRGVMVVNRLQLLGKSASKRFSWRMLAPAVIGFLVAMGIILSMQVILHHFDITLMAAIWQGDNDDPTIRLLDISVIAMLFYVMLFGIACGLMFLVKRGRSAQKKFHRSMPSLHSGYYLELGENGMRYITTTSIHATEWQGVDGFLSQGNISFFSLRGYLLWLPNNLVGDDYPAVAAFIQSKLADNNKIV